MEDDRIQINSLSGSFRLTNKEYGAINHLRYEKRKNLSHISELLKRSLSTVHRAATLGKQLGRVENRGRRGTAYLANEAEFHRTKNDTRLRLKIWFTGLVDSLTEAMDVRAVPIPALRAILSEIMGSDACKEPP